MKGAGRHGLARFAGLLLIAGLSLQVWFALRIGVMAVVDLQSTTFQRSEAWRLAVSSRPMVWRQSWADYAAIGPNLKRAVIASEDAGYTEHGGVEWDALEKAWERNRRAEATADRVNEQAGRRPPRREPAGAEPAVEKPAGAKATANSVRVAKVVGGSTITQQLAKNVFLASERNLVRKAQELVIAWEMEAILDKRRILEVYLNSVEWGEGVFGAQAAAERYFHASASALSATQAARLAVMLPAPKRFEKRPSSPFVDRRTATIAARMSAVDLP